MPDQNKPQPLNSIYYNEWLFKLAFKDVFDDKSKFDKDENEQTKTT